MHAIDFLPTQYRERDLHRKNRCWRIGVVMAVVGALAAGWYALRVKRARVEQELAAARQDHEAVMRQAHELGKLAAQVQALRSRADLIVYLRHPWSRASLLRAVLAPLPESVSLQELRISRFADQQGRPAAERVRLPKQQENPQETFGPAESDLRALRREVDERPTTVLLAGLTADHALLHRYLAQLSKTDLFTQVELLGIDPQESREAVHRFRARLTVLPGYGQPRGPAHPATIMNVTAAGAVNAR